MNNETTKEKIREPEIEVSNNLTNEKKEVVAPNLNPKYTFENFIIGSNNRFAHAAAYAVFENPGKNTIHYLYMGE